MGCVIILYTMYPNLIQRIAEVVQCQDFDWGNGETRRYLIADYRINCDGPEHQTNVLMGWIFILIYGLGIPVGTMVVIKVYIRTHAGPELFYGKGGAQGSIRMAAHYRRGGGNPPWTPPPLSSTPK